MNKTKEQKQEPSKLDFISCEYGMPKGLLRYQISFGMSVSQAVSDWMTYTNDNEEGYYRYSLLVGFMNQFTTKLQKELNECI